MRTIADVKQANPVYFAKGQKEFFNDICYKIKCGRISGDMYLVTNTNGFSDMFGAEKRNFWTVKALDQETLKIKTASMLEFDTLQEVEQYLKEQ